MGDIKIPNGFNINSEINRNSKNQINLINTINKSPTIITNTSIQNINNK